MIAGLIVDTFTGIVYFELKLLFRVYYTINKNIYNIELTILDFRQDSSNRDVLIDNYCLICSKERDEFNECGLDFEHHITTEHNAIYYYYFLAYLKDKIEKDDKLRKNNPHYESLLSLNEEYARESV
jgi:hypothetical protein